MSMLNINELFSDQTKKEKHKEEIYDNVLKQCHKKILRASKLNPYTNYCFYVIPKFIYGIPLYDLNKCINYLVINLSKNGFKINYTHPNLLIITWFKKEDTKINNDILFNTKSNVKSINDYKPSGTLIYNTNYLKDINTKNNYLMN
jgi:hypothetical protein